MKKVCRVYTSASMVFPQKGMQKAMNPIGTSADHECESDCSGPVNNLRKVTEARYRAPKVRQAMRLENRLTLKGMAPIGKNVTALAIKL